MFQLDARLKNDTFILGDFPLCRLLLMNDSCYPWFILVPRRDDLREIHHLEDADQLQFWRESVALSRWMEQEFNYHKLNIAALGNIVSQLHLHHVARTVDDPAWPGPVWGAHPVIVYSADAVEALRGRVKQGSLRTLFVEKVD